MIGTRALQLGLFVIGEVGWLDAWSIALGWWIGPRDEPLLGLPTLLALVVAAAILTGAARRVSERALLAIALLGLIVAILLGFAVLDAARGNGTWAEVWQLWGSTSLGFRHLGVILVALVAWWRGIVAGRTRIDLDRVQSALRGQTIALIVLFVTNALAGSSGAPPASLIGGVLLVIFAGLVGMPLARLIDLRASERGRAGTLGVNQHWVAMLLGAVVGLLVAALALAAIVTFDRLDTLLQPIGAVANLLLLILLYAIGLPIAYVLSWLIGLIPKRGAPPRQMPVGGIQSVIQQLQHQQNAAPSSAWLEILKWGLFALVAVAVVLFLYRAASQYLEKQELEAVDETRDFVWSWDEVKSAVKEWILGWLGRRRPKVAASVSTANGVAGPGLPLDPRALYRELLRLGADRGRRREPSETPLEYERALTAVESFARSEAEVDAITLAYLQARYGEAAPEPRLVDEAREALEKVRGQIDQRVDRPGR